MPSNKKTVKKSAAKTTARKKPSSTAKGRGKKQAKPTILHGSFTLQPESESFFSVKLTHQTLYWVIFSLVVFALGFWVMRLHMAVEEIYDNIEISHANQEIQEHSLRAAQAKSTSTED